MRSIGWFPSRTLLGRGVGVGWPGAGARLVMPYAIPPMCVRRDVGGRFRWWRSYGRSLGGFGSRGCLLHWVSCLFGNTHRLSSSMMPTLHTRYLHPCFSLWLFPLSLAFFFCGVGFSFGGFAWMLPSSFLSLSFTWSLILLPFHFCILLSHPAVHLHGWVANLIFHLYLPLQVCLGGPGLPWMVPCGAAPIGPSTSAPGGVVSPIAERCMASATISRTTICKHALCVGVFNYPTSVSCL